MTVCAVVVLLLANTKTGLAVLLAMLGWPVLLLRVRLGELVAELTLAELGSSGITPSDTIVGF